MNNDMASGYPRMKNHGTFTTLAQVESFLTSHNVSSGKPTDIQPGDYFTLGSYKVYIAGIDTEYNKGNTALTTHHITCIANFGNSKMNSTDTTTGGYNGATVMQDFLTAKATEISGVLSSHLLTRSTLLANSIGSNGKSNNWSWSNKQLTLLSETQIYGAIQWGNVYDTGEAYEKLPIFNKLTPSQLFGRTSIWLRGVDSGMTFCLATYDGTPYYHSASNGRAAVALFTIG
jgi:hypothetical protein